MRFYPALLAILLLGCSQTPATDSSTASATPQVQASATPGGERRGRGERFKKMMEEMDTDHDGKISEAEKVAAFDKMVETSERFRDRVDKDADGKISAEERKLGLENFLKRKGRRHRQRDSEGASPAPSDSETPE